MAALLRRLHAPVGFHRRVSAGDAARERLSSAGGPAEVSAVLAAGCSRPDHQVPGQRVSAFADQADGGADAGRRRKGLSGVRRQDRQRRVSCL